MCAGDARQWCKRHRPQTRHDWRSASLYNHLAWELSFFLHNYPFKQDSNTFDRKENLKWNHSYLLTFVVMKLFIVIRIDDDPTIGEKFFLVKECSLFCMKWKNCNIQMRIRSDENWKNEAPAQISSNLHNGDSSFFLSCFLSLMYTPRVAISAAFWRSPAA